MGHRKWALHKWVPLKWERHKFTENHKQVQSFTENPKQGQPFTENPKQGQHKEASTLEFHNTKTVERKPDNQWVDPNTVDLKWVTQSHMLDHNMIALNMECLKEVPSDSPWENP